MPRLGIRLNLLFGFGGLVIILAVVGLESVTLLTELGQSIDVILRENYRSVIACQEMKDAMERMDGGTLFILLGEKEAGNHEIQLNIVRFERALEEEFSAVSVEGEAAKASHIGELFAQYKKRLREILDESSPLENRRRVYFQDVLPLFRTIINAADEILKMNQDSMAVANDRARAKAAAALNFMLVLLFIGGCVSVTFVLFTRKWILRPIGRLIESAEKIERGRLDVVVPEEFDDEIGQLSRAFNAMASSLRELRRIDHVNLVRVQRSIEQAFKHLPDVVAVFDLQGIAEVTTEAARTIFEITPGTDINRFPLERLALLFHQALRSGSVADSEDGVLYIQRFVNGEERYFRPSAVPILDSDRQPTGVILILADVTQERQQEEAKRGMIATVSHQLKTPLTSIRMAIHLLLDEEVGRLTDKQSELLLAAYVSPGSIVILERPVSKEAILHILVRVASRDFSHGVENEIVRQVLSLGAQSSSFLKEEAAFPNALVEGIPSPSICLAIAKSGISDARSEQQEELVFLVLCASNQPEFMIPLQEMVRRTVRNRSLTRTLKSSRTPEDAFAAIQDYPGGAGV